MPHVSSTCTALLRPPAPPQPGAREPRGGQNVPALAPVQVSCRCHMSGGGKVAAAVSAVACLVGARRRPLGWRHGLSAIAGVPAARKPILPACFLCPTYPLCPVTCQWRHHGQGQRERAAIQPTDCLPQEGIGGHQPPALEVSSRGPCPAPNPVGSCGCTGCACMVAYMHRNLEHLLQLCPPAAP